MSTPRSTERARSGHSALCPLQAEDGAFAIGSSLEVVGRCSRRLGVEVRHVGWLGWSFAVGVVGCGSGRVGGWGWVVNRLGRWIAAGIVVDTDRAVPSARHACRE